MNERKTDYFINRMLVESGISLTPNGSDNLEIMNALKTSSKRGNAKPGYPEFTGFSNDFVIIIEDKADIRKQAHYVTDRDGIELSDDPKAIMEFAENGALHYAQCVIEKTSYKRVFAFGCSGYEGHYLIRPIFVDENGYKILDYVQNFQNFNSENIDRYFREQILGEPPTEEVEISQVMSKASELHEYLESFGGLGADDKPLVVSAIMLALSDPTFAVENLKCNPTTTDGKILYKAIESYLESIEDLPGNKKDVILSQFTAVRDDITLNQVNPILGKTPLKFFAEFIRDNLHKPIISGGADDILGRFYGEFLKYSGGDGQSLGIVLTPKHITTLFCDLLDVMPNDVVFDPCCGTGGFLLAAMNRMINHATSKEQIDDIKRNRLFGIEKKPNMYAIASTNMILRGDGKSNLYCDNFFTYNLEELRDHHFTVGMMNPPYSQGKKEKNKDLKEIKFIEHLLECMEPGARVAVIVPISTMIGSKEDEKNTKKKILEKNTLEGTIVLNKETFYRVGTNPCIAIFTAGKPHPKEKMCKFINFKEDGFVTKKHIGLVETAVAKEKRAQLISCWKFDADANESFMIKSKITYKDEWIHPYFYFDDTIPQKNEFSKAMSDYLSFEFSMVVSGKEHLFQHSKLR